MAVTTDESDSGCVQRVVFSILPVAFRSRRSFDGSTASLSGGRCCGQCRLFLVERPEQPAVLSLDPLDGPASSVLSAARGPAIVGDFGYIPSARPFFKFLLESGRCRSEEVGTLSTTSDGVI